jgi:type I restriction enzyme S subunit
MQNISQGQFGNAYFLFPPKKIQQKIADSLDMRCEAIDAIIAEKESLITDLESYKKSLIFEVVTGKRRVIE